MEEGRLLKVREVCTILKVHPNTLRRWVKAGKIRVVRTAGGRVRIPESEVKRLLAEGPPESVAQVQEKLVPPTFERVNLTSPLPAGLILLGTAMFLSFPLLFQTGAIEGQTFLFQYAVFISLSTASLHLTKRGMIKGDRLAKGGTRVLTCLLIPLSVFCALAACSIFRGFSGLASVFRLILLVSWLFLVGILAEWKYAYG